MQMLKDWLGLIALIITIGTAIVGGYLTSRLTVEREAMRKEFVLREVWEQEARHQRELLAEVKEAVMDTNRTVNDFIMDERREK
jgi:hypothetical protein